MEIRAGLEFGIGFGDGQHAADGGGDCRFRLRPLRTRRPAAAGAAQSRKLVECPAFVARIALHRLDQIGNEIGAALELRVDVAPRLGHDVLPPHEAVVGRDPPQRDHDDNDRNYQPAHGRFI